MIGSPRSQLQFAERAVADLISPAIRGAQARWAATRISQRVRVLRNLRNLMAAEAETIAATVRQSRIHSSPAEIMTSEVWPLLDACKFIEQNATHLLRPQRASRTGRPFWLGGIELEIHLDPVGVILIIGPSNYPLFLVGVQALQALACGNAVLLKPGTGASPSATLLQALAMQAGIEPDLLTILDEDPATATEAILAGVDKVVLTGSSSTGTRVLKVAAETLTPVLCELSGCDAVIVLPGADLEGVAACLAFGLRLNASQTCMRPHRVLVHKTLAAELIELTVARVSDMSIPLGNGIEKRLMELVRDSRYQTVRKYCGRVSGSVAIPFVFDGVDSESPLWCCDISAPILAFRSFLTEAEALRDYNACSYALGASVFGPLEQARSWAAKVNAGFVVVNDIIVPTADPRLPFSGRGHSGFGSTRGAEGLLEFTRVKAITVRRGSRRHLLAEHTGDAEMFSGAIVAAHGKGWRQRLGGMIRAFKSGMQRSCNSHSENRRQESTK